MILIGLLKYFSHSTIVTELLWVLGGLPLWAILIYTANRIAYRIWPVVGTHLIKQTRLFMGAYLAECAVWLCLMPFSWPSALHLLLPSVAGQLGGSLITAWIFGLRVKRQSGTNKFGWWGRYAHITVVAPPQSPLMAGLTGFMGGAWNPTISSRINGFINATEASFRYCSPEQQWTMGYNWNTYDGMDMKWNPLKPAPYTPPRWPRNLDSRLVMEWINSEIHDALALKRLQDFVPTALGFPPSYDLEKNFILLEQAIMKDFNIPWDHVGELRMGYFKWLCAQGYVVKPDILHGATAPPSALDDLSLNSLPTLERVIAAGYRSLAKAAHPDAGGDPDKFHELQEAKEKLDLLVAELKEAMK